MRTPMFVLAASLALSAQTPDSSSAPPVVEPVETSRAASVATDSASVRDSSVLATSASVADSTSAFSPAVSSTPKRQIAVDSTKSAAVPRKSSLKRLPQVAVLSFTGDGIAAKDLNAVTSRFESELLATDSFKVVERRNVDKILKEQGFLMSGACDNSECSVEIGQILSVDGIYTGELAKVGKTWSLSVKRTEVGTSQTTFSHVLDIQGSLEDVLRGGCPEMALIASGRKTPESSRTVLVAKKGSMWPWIAGGAVVVGGGVAAAILLGQDESTTSSPTTTNRTVDITFDTGK